MPGIERPTIPVRLLRRGHFHFAFLMLGVLALAVATGAPAQRRQQGMGQAGGGGGKGRTERRGGGKSGSMKNFSAPNSRFGSPGRQVQGPPLAELIKAVDSPESIVRVDAIRALRARAANDITSAVPALSRALAADPASSASAAQDLPWVRQEAAQTLEQIGPPAKAAIPALVVLLTDPNEAVRDSVIQAIRAIDPGNPQALPGLISAMPGTDPEGGNEHAAEAVLLEWPVTPDSIRAFLRAARAKVQALERKDSSRRLGVDFAECASRFIDRLTLEHRAAAPDFIALSREPQLSLKRLGLTGLTRLGAVPEEFIPTLLKLAFGVRSADSAWAADVLIALGPKAAPAAPDLVRILKSPAGRGNFLAERILVSIGRPAADPALPVLDQLIRDGLNADLVNPADVFLLCQYLLALDPASKTALEGLDNLAGMANTNDPLNTDLRAQAALLKAGRQPAQRLAALREGLKSAGERRRVAAIRLILAHGSDPQARREALDASFAIMDQSRDATNIGEMSEGLKLLGPADGAAAPRLIKRIQALAAALGESGRRDTEISRRMIEDAVTALGRLGPAAREGLPVLRELLRSGLPEPQPKNDAASAFAVTVHNFSRADHEHFRKIVADAIKGIDAEIR